MSGRPCPFPGLLPFQEKDRYYFFGRDRETGELLRRLEQNRFLAVIGVSGSGKSSLVHAGLKPELRFGPTPWRIVEMKPGGGPRVQLEKALRAELPGPQWRFLRRCVCSAAVTRNWRDRYRTIRPMKPFPDYSLANRQPTQPDNSQTSDVLPTT